jgi:hypothetical protein
MRERPSFNLYLGPVRTASICLSPGWEIFSLFFSFRTPSRLYRLYHFSHPNLDLDPDLSGLFP